MFQKHAWAGIFHNRPYLLFHHRLVAMYMAVGTSCFILLKRTPVKSQPGIIQKLSTVQAKFLMSSMEVVTIYLQHSLYGLFFS